MSDPLPLLLLGAAQRARLGLRLFACISWPPAQAVPGTALAAVCAQSCMPPGVCHVAFAGAVLDIDGGPPCAAAPLASAVKRKRQADTSCGEAARQVQGPQAAS